jgi:hypothetical protein
MIVFSEFYNLFQYAYDEEGIIGFCFFDKIIISRYGFAIIK